MNYAPFIVFAVVIVAMLALSARNRRRQAEAVVTRAERLQVGAEVMTTSGLYGTIVARNDDDTATLSIAPGVEVRWDFAALRDVAELPGRAAAGGRERLIGEPSQDDTPDDPFGDTEPGSVDLNKSDRRRGVDPAA